MLLGSQPKVIEKILNEFQIVGWCFNIMVKLIFEHCSIVVLTSILSFYYINKILKIKIMPEAIFSVLRGVIFL